jgi:hypothetical protein
MKTEMEWHMTVVSEISMMMSLQSDISDPPPGCVCLCRMGDGGGGVDRGDSVLVDCWEVQDLLLQPVCAAPRWRCHALDAHFVACLYIVQTVRCDDKELPASLPWVQCVLLQLIQSDFTGYFVKKYVILVH